MNLRIEDLKNIFLKSISSKPGTFDAFCPPSENIMEAIRFPSKRTRRIMTHVLDCHKCLSLFLFFKEMTKAEEELISSIIDLYSSKNKMPSRRKVFLRCINFLKLAPYSAIIILIGLLLFTSVKYFNSSKDSTIRSPWSKVHLFLVQDKMATDLGPYLKWNSIHQAKSYSIHIFDASLMYLWHGLTYENRCLLPTDISEKIKSGQRLIIYFEAQDEEGKVIYNWLGELPSLHLISGQK